MKLVLKIVKIHNQLNSNNSTGRTVCAERVGSKRRPIGRIKSIVGGHESVCKCGTCRRVYGTFLNEHCTSQFKYPLLNEASLKLSPVGTKCGDRLILLLCVYPTLKMLDLSNFMIVIESILRLTTPVLPLLYEHSNQIESHLAT